MKISLTLLAAATALMLGCNQKKPQDNFEMREYNPPQDKIESTGVSLYYNQIQALGRFEKMALGLLDQLTDLQQQDGVLMQIVSTLKSQNCAATVTRDDARHVMTFTIGGTGCSVTADFKTEKSSYKDNLWNIDFSATSQDTNINTMNDISAANLRGYIIVEPSQGNYPFAELMDYQLRGTLNSIQKGNIDVSFKSDAKISKSIKYGEMKDLFTLTYVDNKSVALFRDSSYDDGNTKSSLSLNGISMTTERYDFVKFSLDALYPVH